MDTYHTAYWSDPSYSCSSDEEDRYTVAIGMSQVYISFEGVSSYRYKVWKSLTALVGYWFNCPLCDQPPLICRVNVVIDVIIAPKCQVNTQEQDRGGRKKVVALACSRRIG